MDGSIRGGGSLARDEEEVGMSKVAFCFPGQGSLAEGMGREIAEAVPEAMAVYVLGSKASGLDLQHLCFEAPMLVHLFGYCPHRALVHRPRPGGCFLSDPAPSVSHRDEKLIKDAGEGRGGKHGSRT
jgi:malonyl CoA-acyl carrier protein transacylase